MSELTSRDRVLRTFRFEETDRAPFDLMEAIVWPGLQDWCRAQLGLGDKDAILDHFDVDFRWFWPEVKPPAGIDLLDPRYFMPYTGSFSDHTQPRPLKDVQTIEEMLEKHAWADPTWWDMSPVHAVRARYPDKAIVMLVHTTMLFMTACDFFGIEEALLRFLSEDDVLLEFLRLQNEFAMAAFRRACREAQGSADICWFMDDLATQRTLMMRPDLWRRHLKEPLRQQVAVMHEYGLRSLFHSCGAIRDILPDLIEIGVDAVLPFQTAAEGMEAGSIAREFGGRIVFYGGLDVQHLLTFGTEDDVRRGVRGNLDAFERTGGYIVANSHHCVDNIQPANVRAMLEEARRDHPMARRGKMRGVRSGG